MFGWSGHRRPWMVAESSLKRVGLDPRLLDSCNCTHTKLVACKHKKLETQHRDKGLTGIFYRQTKHRHAELSAPDLNGREWERERERFFENFDFSAAASNTKTIACLRNKINKLPWSLKKIILNQLSSNHQSIGCFHLISSCDRTVIDSRISMQWMLSHSITVTLLLFLFLITIDQIAYYYYLLIC